MVKTTVHDLKIDCYAYDVAKDPVSVHIPVVRLFVGKIEIEILYFYMKSTESLV